MGDLSILGNLVAAIHSIRSEHIVNQVEDLDESQEVDQITSKLLVLESECEEFENIELVGRLKKILSDLLISNEKSKSTSAFLLQSNQSNDSSSSSDNVLSDVTAIIESNNIFNTIRTNVIQEIRTAIALIDDNGDALIDTNFKTVNAQKKKKNDNYFTSFNFDDLPEYEHLEVTLKILRNDPCKEHSLKKILDMDCDELVEHPQWR